MRTLQNIRSDRVTLRQQSPAGGAAALTAVPLACLIAMAWVFAPLASGGPLIVSLALGGLVAWQIRSALPRKVELALPLDGVLVWQDGIEDQDIYRVVLQAGTAESILFENDDPAHVLTDVRRVCQETGLRFEGPEWTRLEPEASLGSGRRVVLVSGSDEGLRWLAQRDAAWSVVGGAVFVFLVFLGSVRWEAELTWFSALLPLVSIAILFCIAAVLFSLRVRVTATREGVQVDRVIFGRSRRRLEFARSDLVSARAVGHAGHAPRHLLFETLQGPRAVAIAGRAALLAAERVRVELTPDGPSRGAPRGRATPDSRDFLSHS